MNYVWLIIAIAAVPATALFFKAGMLRVGQSPQNLRKLPRFLLKTVSDPFVILAIISLIVGSTSFTFAISESQLSYVNTLYLAVPVVLIAIFSSLLFKEKVSGVSWLGIATICVGVTIFGIFGS
jgi:multidrug transporter EmrE-like cation transporter